MENNILKSQGYSNISTKSKFYSSHLHEKRIKISNNYLIIAFQGARKTKRKLKISSKKVRQKIRREIKYIEETIQRSIKR